MYHDLIGHVLSKFKFKNYSLNPFDPFQFIDNWILMFALPAFIIIIILSTQFIRLVWVFIKRRRTRSIYWLNSKITNQYHIHINHCDIRKHFWLAATDRSTLYPFISHYLSSSLNHFLCFIRQKMKREMHFVICYRIFNFLSIHLNGTFGNERNSE